MAEAIGVVSSGFAVVSIALQLVEAAQQLHTFWHSFHESGSDVERIKNHLATLQAVATNIADTCQNEPQYQYAESVVNSLLACKARTDKLAHLTRNISRNAQAGPWEKGWISLRATFRDSTIRRVESQLHGDVMMLLLSLQPFFHRTHHQMLKLIDSNISKEPIDMRMNSRLEGIDTHESVIANGKKLPDLMTGRASSSVNVSALGPASISQQRGRYLCIRVDSFHAMEYLLGYLGTTMTEQWRVRLQRYVFGINYSSAAHYLYFDNEPSVLRNIKRRFKIRSLGFVCQLQTTSLPRSITYIPIVPCQSQIFKLCLEGNVEKVKAWFKSSRISPCVVNHHGENLLHFAARYAHADLCNLLLDIGVDGAAYDDRLLTPLDHLARRVCMSIAYPTQVVNTIRALVERGRCQPLRPITNNAVAFYSGPEGGFAWLFASEYEGMDLEELDSESWTLLGDAALNFGSWTELCIDDPAVSWPCLYLLRAGANPHAISSEGKLTPLDAYLRGCTTHHVDHARKWLQILSQSGIDLQKYVTEEQRLHQPEHTLNTSWDEELWRWINIKRRVIYEFGETSDQLHIWLEDYDALNWFGNGRFDLDLFSVCTTSESEARWQKINEADNKMILDEQDDRQSILRLEDPKTLSFFQFVFSTHWLQLLMLSLVLHYLFHVILVGH